MKNLDNIVFENQKVPINITLNGSYNFANAERVNRAVHEAIEIKYFCQGESTLLVDTQTINVSPGDVVVINPFEVHSTVERQESHKAKYHLILVGLDFFNALGIAEYDLRTTLLGNKIRLKNHFRNDEYLQGVLDKLVEEKKKGDQASPLMIYGLVAQLFAYLLENGVSKSGEKQSDVYRYYDLIEPAIRKIRDNFEEEFTIDQLAEECKISKFHFCKIFKQVMGMGAISYLNEHRLKIAWAMLNNTNKRVQEVAVECGFTDVGYFCKLFKRKYGVSPSRTR